ncbi:MAG: family 20 glycosylhydrolase [Bacteroidota bacterium]
MKKLTYLLLLLSYTTLAQIKNTGNKDEAFSTFYQQRSSLFRVLPQSKGDIIFLGNSITNGNEWDELFNDANIKNRGISGDGTLGVLNRLDEVTVRKPGKIFLLIGVNDLAAGYQPDSVVQKIFLITKKIHEQSPGTKLYIQSLLPVNNAFNKFPNHVNKSEQIKQVNVLLQKGAALYSYNFIDLYPSFCNTDGKLDTLYTNDGLHEKGAGYMLWKHLIYPYVYDLQNKPSLLPQPQSINYNDQLFPLYRCRTIILKDLGLKKEAVYLQQELAARGWIVKIQDHVLDSLSPVIILGLDKVISPRGQQEAYRLNVTSNSIKIEASTAHGCFNALQTLFQLMRDNSMVPGVNITDYPAFSWRGYMVDVGRNFESMDLLKQQIDIMARYKLNVFHFHFTEDIAWRLQIKQYPQLTELGNMQRNAGAYYTVDELKELIQYCKDRYITLIPEIDMPGHSAAFTRAFGVNMQTDSGTHIVKNIIKEFCSTYDIPYLHIGGDEVKITNPRFLPAMIKYIHDLGKQTIGWSPGGNLDAQTIRQLWMKDGAVDSKLKYIDSRNLYINHMDPLESVVSIFNRKLCDADFGNNQLLGATLCLWPDRNVIKQEDILTMNPVYPAMLAFAERSWDGGGKPGWHTSIMNGDTTFSAFENRLTDQQKQCFGSLPFTYIQQANIKWKLFGPFANKGNLAKKFAPEQADFNADKEKIYTTVTGGTLILRHFWHPAVEGVLDKVKDSTTCYAYTKVWSNQDTTSLMWIGFYNISRSVPTSTPQLRTWDDRKSEIWINHQLVAPPVWAHAGQVGNIEKPLVDEGYDYRRPIPVQLKMGWNQLMVKLPVGSFNSTKGQVPVKWMFTAVFVKPFGSNYLADDQVVFMK